MGKLKKDYDCSLNLTFDLLGGKWKLRMLWHIIHGDNRFSLIKSAMDGAISEKMLTTQLRELEAAGIIARTVITEKPLNVIYAIAKDYRGIEKIIEELCEFSVYYANKNDITVKKP